MYLGFMLLDTSDLVRRINVKLARRLHGTAEPIYYTNAEAWLLRLIQRNRAVSVFHQ